MDKKNEVSIAAVILNCIYAAVWNILVFIDLAYGFPNVFHIILAIAIDFIAGIWVLRYLKSKKNN